MQKRRRRRPCQPSLLSKSSARNRNYVPVGCEAPVIQSAVLGTCGAVLLLSKAEQEQRNRPRRRPAERTYVTGLGRTGRACAKPSVWQSLLVRRTQSSVGRVRLRSGWVLRTSESCRRVRQPLPACAKPSVWQSLLALCASAPGRP